MDEVCRTTVTENHDWITPTRFNWFNRLAAGVIAFFLTFFAFAFVLSMSQSTFTRIPITQTDLIIWLLVVPGLVAVLGLISKGIETITWLKVCRKCSRIEVGEIEVGLGRQADLVRTAREEEQAKSILALKKKDSELELASEELIYVKNANEKYAKEIGFLKGKLAKRKKTGMVKG